jgi:two-component system phosphate regulon response regulator PhoB
MPLRIMIVEDEEPLLELLRYNFERAGYAVDTVSDGQHVEARLEKSVPDVLIVDWMLPGLSGIELCWRLRRRPATRSLPLMMLTARSEEPDRVRAIKAGADDYIVKPFSVGELIARVEALLSKRTQRAWMSETTEPA